ncbi:MAG TPA: hypothetical protein PLB97_06825, partial [Accumulibacter sp.]|nr:hypothetical protein [Accumulibacter sp.]
YVDPEADNEKKDDGFISKLFSFGSSKKPQTQYRIHLNDAGSQTTVQVLSAEGGADQSSTVRRILGLLHDQLK